jgi:hypothetical protein
VHVGTEQASVMRWTVRIETTGDAADASAGFDEQLDAFRRALADLGGAVFADPELGWYGTTFTIESAASSVVGVVDDALLAFRAAVVVADLPPWPVIRCEVAVPAGRGVELAPPGFT